MLLARRNTVFFVSLDPFFFGMRTVAIIRNKLHLLHQVELDFPQRHCLLVVEVALLGNGLPQHVTIPIRRELHMNLPLVEATTHPNRLCFFDHALVGWRRQLFHGQLLALLQSLFITLEEVAEHAGGLLLAAREVNLLADEVLAIPKVELGVVPLRLEKPFVVLVLGDFFLLRQAAAPAELPAEHLF